jgi:hypothetical protein
MFPLNIGQQAITWGLVAGVVALGGIATTKQIQLSGARANLAHEQKARSDDSAAYERAARQQADDFRADDERRREAQRKAIEDAALETQMARDSADRSARALGLLKLAAGKAAASSSQAASSTAPVGSSPSERLAEVLGQCGERYSAVARAADDAIIAGRACERSYDALIKAGTPEPMQPGPNTSEPGQPSPASVPPSAQP